MPALLGPALFIAFVLALDWLIGWWFRRFKPTTKPTTRDDWRHNECPPDA